MPTSLAATHRRSRSRKREEAGWKWELWGWSRCLMGPAALEMR